MLSIDGKRNPRNGAPKMTIMTDTTGKLHRIERIENVRTLEAIGWTVVTVTPGNVDTIPTPSSERDWDAIFGRWS
jgi:hypothetical protein